MRQQATTTKDKGTGTTTTVTNISNGKSVTTELKPKREAFCIKCRARHMIEDGQKINMKNGRMAFKGTCSNCKKIVCTLIKKTG